MSSNNQFTSPVIIQGIGSESSASRCTSLEKVDFSSREYNEKFIQEFLYNNCESIPIVEIESIFLPLVPICTELNTPVGPLDILYINDEGLITVAECKLWSNPESRREVVGQILDYAKELHRWGYEGLNKALQSRLGRSGNVLFDIVKEHFPEVDERAFHDKVSINLKRGRFLLLIIGDGIRHGVEHMFEYLQKHANLNFTFGLVEMGIYRLPKEIGEGYLVQPRILARTYEFERHIFRIEDDKITVEPVAARMSAPRIDQARRYTLTEQSFYESPNDIIKASASKLRDFLTELTTSYQLKADFGQGSVMIKSLDGNFNFAAINTSGDVTNYGVVEKSTKITGSPGLGLKYLDDISQMIPGAVVDKSTKEWAWTVKKDGKPVLLTEYLSHKERWKEIIIKTLEKLSSS